MAQMKAGLLCLTTAQFLAFCGNDTFFPRKTKFRSSVKKHQEKRETNRGLCFFWTIPVQNSASLKTIVAILCNHQHMHPTKPGLPKNPFTKKSPNPKPVEITMTLKVRKFSSNKTLSFLCHPKSISIWTNKKIPDE